MGPPGEANRLALQPGSTDRCERFGPIKEVIQPIPESGSLRPVFEPIAVELLFQTAK